MTRSELVATLADLVRRKAITAAEGATLLNRFDAGALVDIPLPAATKADNDWLLALALLMLLLNRQTVRPLSGQEQLRARKTLRAQFEQRTQSLATDVAGGASVADWQGGMQDSIALYAHQMAVAGAGTLPSVGVRRAVDERLRGQWGYLAAFAVTLLAKREAEVAVSEAAIASRSALYGATGWGSFFQAQGDGRGAGWVDLWITKDDRKVCHVCHPRHLQYFLPWVGPWPGPDCLGTCRCVRKPEYNPEMYARLGGR
jgi:hypothetical protein